MSCWVIANKNREGLKMYSGFPHQLSRKKLLYLLYVIALRLSFIEQDTMSMGSFIFVKLLLGMAWICSALWKSFLLSFARRNLNVSKWFSIWTKIMEIKQEKSSIFWKAVFVPGVHKLRFWNLSGYTTCLRSKPIYFDGYSLTFSKLFK